MKPQTALWAAVLSIVVARAALSQETDLAKRLETLIAQIKQKPDAPMLYYKKAQCLMAMNRYDEGYQTAKQAMGVFVKQKNDLAWMLLESIELEHLRIDVHFNMGPEERSPPATGIIRPLSFRVWSKDKEAKLLEILDFEIAMLDGKPSTAAIGQTTPQYHANYGIIDMEANYEEIRKKVVRIIKTRHPNP